MNLEEATELVKEYHKDKESELPATLFIPMREYSEFYQEYRSVNRYTEKPPKIKEVTVESDDVIEDPVVLPDSFTGSYPLVLKDPPIEHIKRLTDIEKIEYMDPIRGDISQYKSYVWLKPFCKWQRFDEEMVEKYGHPKYKSNLDSWTKEDHEYTQTEFDHCERKKFGFENVFSSQMKDSDIDVESFGDDRAERQMSKAIHEHLWDVYVEPVYIYRKRTIKGVHPVLDIEHEERLKFGKHATTYEGMLMRKIDTDVHKMEMRK